MSMIMVLWCPSSTELLNTFITCDNHLIVFAAGSSTVPGFFNTMRKQFTAYEWQTIKSQTTEWKQLEMFYRHWVSVKNKLGASTVT